MTQPEKNDSPTSNKDAGCGCLLLIFLITSIFGGCSHLFNSDNSSSSNSSSGICVGNACWDSAEDLEKDVCKADPSLRGCDKYKN